MDPRTGKVYEIGEDNTFVLTDPRALMNSVNSPLIINERNCIHFCKHCAERNCDKRSRHTRAICEDFDPAKGCTDDFRTRFGSDVNKPNRR